MGRKLLYETIQHFYIGHEDKISQDEFIQDVIHCGLTDERSSQALFVLTTEYFENRGNIEHFTLSIFLQLFNDFNCR